MTSSTYTNYRDSEAKWLGNIPEHWSTSPVWGVASCNDEVLAEATPDDAEITYVEISGVTAGVGITDVSEINFADAPSRARRKVENGDILVSTVRTYLRAIAPAINPPANLVASTGFAVLRPRKVNSGFLGYAVQAEFFIFQVIARSVGVSYPAINASDLVRIALPIPPHSEQTAIATFLDRETGKIDGLVEEQKRLIELLKEKRQAIISHAVIKGLNPDAPMKDTGIEWLGEVPEHWEVKRIKHVKAPIANSFVDGPFGSNLKSEHFIDDGEVYVIESSFATQGRLNPDDLKSISMDHFQTIKRSEAIEGDIIIAKIGAQFGKSSILPRLDKPCVVSGNSLKLTIDNSKISTQLVHWQLINLKNCGAVDVGVNGSAQPALSLGDMNNLPILVPPALEQEEIASFLAEGIGRIRALSEEAQRTIDLLQERRAALISAAVTGKIDVRGLAEAQEAAE
ncbi:restriction endonuclease subunit S [Rhizobium leguminosarum]|uniref:restriction endonuclease subunit S n=1 Tax=Rhizobium leguminosarum TaxID=384 RepID=UPI00103B3E88|nr:restriction endonuclease subunit S [Rhizobium leguminosarum]TBY49362.1 restriction endonuclease subunit S [Rhizobium leguminosarum bv. viciae]